MTDALIVLVLTLLKPYKNGESVVTSKKVPTVPIDCDTKIV